MTKNNTHL